ncbi:MAG: fused MFS/spermidine synthase [Sandaracinaceae bacterium]|nr:fused MFS/spermidine synthase [Sandaracinaceae bacterium]
MRLAIYASTILGSALLLFAVQPMVGKALLPRLGGVPGAWTACLLFFQAALLVGYGYVWAGVRAPFRVRVAAHVALLAVGALLVVPFGWLDGVGGLSSAESPVAYALAYLGANVGLAFALLSATTPLLSSWYAASGGGRPYFLYAASNAGSLGALVAYPVLVEPWMDLDTQALVFRVGFGAIAIAIAVAGAMAIGAGADTVRPARSDERLTWRRRAKWAGLAFIPTTLLAGSTSYVSTDLAPLPLIWVLPLAIYLASFIVAFGERFRAPPPLLGRAACLVAVVLVFVTTSHANEPVWLLGTMHLLFLGAGSWIAHRRLAEDAPHPDHLPEFYVWIAAGGVLGTLVTAVVAPLVLPDLWEYPAAIAFACMARGKGGIVQDDRPWKQDVPHVLAVAAIAAGLRLTVPLLGVEDPQIVGLISFVPAAFYSYRWMPLRRRYTLCLLALVLAAGLTQERGDRRLTDRSFFGVVRVVDAGEERHLLHGTTLHGTQRLDQRDRCEPMAYYVPQGPLGAVFRAHRAAGRHGRSVAIGLGTGAVACYAAPDEPWRIIEINPDVIEIASDPRWFTYLSNSPGDVDVTLGDGRIGLTEERDASLSLIVVDAFNSDSVPVHLLTREAIRLYLEKLEPGGWVVLHLSNRVLDLPRVVADVVAAEGVHAVLADDENATYAVVARDAEALAPLAPPYWQPLAHGVAARAWTDSFSSLTSAFQPPDDPWWPDWAR